jgi:hypothetical protein
MSGQVYRLRYRAHNVHGWSDFSPIGEIIAATIPSQIEEPSTSINDVNVEIQWNFPANTGGTNVQISSYRVELLTMSNELIETCTTSDLYCLFPMADLLEDPYFFE